jgi:glycosyltransferase involved in cell wall biosynthesis
MIPAYEPGQFLVETLRSILAQDPGQQTMQIAIVDDASPRVDVEALIASVAPAGRIEIHRNTENLGLAGNWNRSIELARGQLVHLLHQDDLILPGFYSRLLHGFATAPDAGMAFCRHAFVDDTGHWTRRSHRERWRAGILRDWLRGISRRQLIQCPAAIVRRVVYENLGGFRSDLTFALDWEMWVRIAAAHDVWYEPKILACYRRHRGSETTRLSASGMVGADTLRAIEIFSRHIPADSRVRFVSRAYQRLVKLHLRDGNRMLKSGSPERAREQIGIARAALQQLPAGMARRLRWQQLQHLESRCASNSASLS